MVPPENIAYSAFLNPPVVSGTLKNPIEGRKVYRRGRLRGSIVIGDVEFKRPIVDVTPEGQNRAKLWTVGTEALREFIVTLDQRQGLMQLVRASRSVNPPSFERGIGLLTSIKVDGFLVDLVVPGGEGERKGVVAGDVITSFDGVAASEESWPKFLALKRGERAFQVVVRHDHDTKRVTLIPSIEVP